MDQQPAFEFSFDFLGSKPIVVEPSAAQLTSDAGLLPFRELDERIGLTRQFSVVAIACCICPMAFGQLTRL